MALFTSISLTSPMWSSDLHPPKSGYRSEEIVRPKTIDHGQQALTELSSMNFSNTFRSHSSQRSSMGRVWWQLIQKAKCVCVCLQHKAGRRRERNQGSKRGEGIGIKGGNRKERTPGRRVIRVWNGESPASLPEFLTHLLPMASCCGKTKGLLPTS